MHFGCFYGRSDRTQELLAGVLNRYREPDLMLHCSMLVLVSQDEHALFAKVFTNSLI